MRLLRYSHLLLIASVAALAAVNCGGKAAGSEGGACYANATCDTGLICRSDLCVDPNETSAGSGGNGFDLNECLACGEGQCADPATECNGSAGCSKVLNCWLECVGDVNCQNACDVQGVTQADLQLVASYFQCIAMECVSDCVPEVPTGTGGGGGGNGTGGGGNGTGGGVSSGDPCSAGDESRGSCLTNDYEVCEEGSYVAGDCAGCGIVTPAGRCELTSAFALQQSGTEFLPVSDAEIDYVQSSAAVTATWYVDASQAGVIQYVITGGIDPSRVDITVVGSVEFVTLENASATGGCQYVLGNDGRLSRYNQVEFIEGSPTVTWYGCWGSYEAYTATEPTDFTILNVRTPVSPQNDEIGLTISSILL